MRRAASQGDQVDPIVQEGVDIHENVHVIQLQPYRSWRFFGNTAYFFNGPGWKVEAYQAQLNLLNGKLQVTSFNAPAWSTLGCEMNRVFDNYK
jgi:hypothetical protein